MLPSPNFVDPSLLTDAFTYIPSSITIFARPKKAIILLSGPLPLLAPINPAFKRSCEAPIL